VLEPWSAHGGGRLMIPGTVQRVRDLGDMEIGIARGEVPLVAVAERDVCGARGGVMRGMCNVAGVVGRSV
jgi:hypothetical protein